MSHIIVKPWPSPTFTSQPLNYTPSNGATTIAPILKITSKEELEKAVKDNPVAVVGRRGCCMVHVVNRLLQGQGVNPIVCEVGEDQHVVDDKALVNDLIMISMVTNDDNKFANPSSMALPLVFIGGCLVGALDELMALHISGQLVPLLKEARALWL